MLLYFTFVSLLCVNSVKVSYDYSSYFLNASFFNTGNLLLFVEVSALSASVGLFCFGVIAAF